MLGGKTRSGNGCAGRSGSVNRARPVRLSTMIVRSRLVNVPASGKRRSVWSGRSRKLLRSASRQRTEASVLVMRGSGASVCVTTS